MGFTYYYKIKIFIDDGVQQLMTWKYVFADNEDKAKEHLLRYYNSQYDTYAQIIEVYTYPIRDAMMFDSLSAI